jgi:hypothetical protein
MSPWRLCDCRSLQDCATCPAARECVPPAGIALVESTLPRIKGSLPVTGRLACAQGIFDRLRRDTLATLDRLTHRSGCICNGRRSRPAPHCRPSAALEDEMQRLCRVENVTSYDTSNVCTLQLNRPTSSSERTLHAQRKERIALAWKVVTQAS